MNTEIIRKMPLNTDIFKKLEAYAQEGKHVQIQGETKINKKTQNNV